MMITLMLLAAVPQDTPPPSPQRIVNAQVYGEDACPAGAADEIVVCRRLPESDRFRLPPRFRQAEPQAGNTAWATRVETIDEVSRQATGMPNTCSTIGPSSGIGCTQDAIRRWYAERRAQQAIAAEADGSNRGQ